MNENRQQHPAGEQTVDLSVRFCGIPLTSPFVLGSGPLGNTAWGLAACYQNGAGAVTTKTIYRKPSPTVSPCMTAQGARTMLNNEGGSDLAAEAWVQEELPRAKELGATVVIANIGEYMDEDARLAQDLVAAGADIIEVGGYLEAEELVETAALVKKSVSVPVIAKVSPNWRNITAEEAALRLLECGLDGVTAMDSVGTGMRFDLRTGRPLLGKQGHGYLSGAGILPLSLKAVYEIARRTDRDIIGLGGITTGLDAMEMLMAGAACCGVCTYPIMYGPEAFAKLNRELAKALADHGFQRPEQVRGRALSAGDCPPIGFDEFCYDGAKCTHCGRCISACAFHARSERGGAVAVDENLCRRCGLCFTVCKTGAITLKGRNL